MDIWIKILLFSSLLNVKLILAYHYDSHSDFSHRYFYTSNHTNITYDYFINLKYCPTYEYSTLKGYFSEACRCYGNQVCSNRKCVTCPQGWVGFENRCYLISDHKRSWYDAKEFCQLHSGRLLTIDSKVMIDFSFRFFERFNLFGSFIVGAHINSKTFKWQWLSGKIIPSNGPWWIECYLPSNKYGDYFRSNEGCAELSKYGLNDIDCLSFRQRFICESVFEDYERKEQEDKRYNFKEKNSVDYPKKCAHNFQCTDNLECRNSYCSCPYTFHWSSTSKKCFKCPPNFVFFQDKCYYISKYTANFSRANEICNNYRSSLLTIKTRVKVDFLNDLMHEFYLSGNFWLGGLSLNGTSYWLDGCIIDNGPWWNYCRLTNSSTNETLCLNAGMYGLEKSSCSTQLPFICIHGIRNYYKKMTRTSTSSSSTLAVTSSATQSLTNSVSFNSFANLQNTTIQGFTLDPQIISTFASISQTTEQNLVSSSTSIQTETESTDANNIDNLTTNF